METEDFCGCIGCEIVKVKDLIRTAVWESGTQGVVIGMSGGIDSAVACALAVKALSAERVLGVFMPASETGYAEYADASAVCTMLGVRLITVPIDGIIAAYRALPEISENPADTGNIAARTRMTVLYNIAASGNRLVCGTSNRTEYLIGYSTKWGDGAADLQPLLHLYKKDVYALAEELGIPESVINKAPSAGFYAGQTDESDLGIAYRDLDPALASLERNNCIPQTVLEEKILEMMKKSEHKRLPPYSKLRYHPLSLRTANIQ